jgi:hypothetical protein
MKPAQAKAILQDCLKRGWVRKGDKIYTPSQAAAIVPANVRKVRIVHNKTGWIDDTRNIANKEKHADAFVTLVRQEVKLEAWPEFHFLLKPDPDYRFDYAIPITPNSGYLKIAIEVEGGIWAKGNSGHSSGTGIMRDMKKASLAGVNGWILIRRTPGELLTMETIHLIQKAIENRKNFF